MRGNPSKRLDVADVTNLQARRTVRVDRRVRLLKRAECVLDVADLLQVLR